MRMFLPTFSFSPGQTLPVREETPSSNLQLIQGAQTLLPPPALLLPKDLQQLQTHSSRDQPLLQGRDLQAPLPHSLLSAGPHSFPAPAFPSPFPSVIWLKNRR